MTISLPPTKSRMAKARLRPCRKYLYECGGCGAYHPLGFEGDCRDDANRIDDPTGYYVVDEYGQPPEETVS